ncbi:MAG: ABC transporter permease [Moraxellaceae bacterium]|nr:ABC transporter permease [Moraxellaceae bacterium]
MKNFLALFMTRNREFYRDKGSLSWSILFPLILIFGLSFALSNDRHVYRVGVLGEPTASINLLASLPHLDIVPYTDEALALHRLTRHQLDMVMAAGTPAPYWINTQSKKAFFLEQSLRQQHPDGLEKRTVTGDEVGYVAWVIPGVLSMSLMFSCLYGVGYVIVRYRDLGVLKRYRATPVTALEFLSAQAASRLLISVGTLAAVFTGSHWLLGFPVQGSYALLLLVAVVGAASMIALSLLCAARIDSLEFMNGLLNLISWPMMLLSGLWFPLDEAPELIRQISLAMPLTHVVNAARAVMLDGAGLMQILPALAVLTALTVVLMGLAAFSFRWQKE